MNVEETSFFLRKKFNNAKSFLTHFGFSAELQKIKMSYCMWI